MEEKEIIVKYVNLDVPPNCLMFEYRGKQVVLINEAGVSR